MTMTLQFINMRSQLLFEFSLFLLSSLITGLCFESISSLVHVSLFFYKGFTRNPEIKNISIWVLPNTCRLGRSMDTKYADIFLVNRYWMLQNTIVTFFIVSELLRGNQQRGGGGERGEIKPSTHIRVKISSRYYRLDSFESLL